jgi:predicted DNA-binding protein
MLRKAYSVRFPPALAYALDTLAARLGHSRSDFVERILRDLDAEDRDAIARTAVADAPTEKRNLRLSGETLARLTELAGDGEASDFLRRTIAYIVASAPAELLQEPPSPAQGPGARQAHIDETFEVCPPGSAGGPVVLLIFLVAFGALISFVVWLIHRLSDRQSSGPNADARGRRPDGTAGGPGA